MQLTMKMITLKHLSLFTIEIFFPSAVLSFFCLILFFFLIYPQKFLFLWADSLFMDCIYHCEKINY